MAKASHSHTTRRAVLSAGLTAVAVAPTLPVVALPAPPVRPSNMGLEMLRLLPEYAEAVWYGCHIDGCDDPNKDDIREWERQSWEPIAEMAGKAANFVDIAIAHRIYRGSEAVYTWNEVNNPPDVLSDRLTAQVLAAANISELACNVDALWVARGYMGTDGCVRTPTAEEWREALTRPDARWEAV